MKGPLPPSRSVNKGDSRNFAISPGETNFLGLTYAVLRAGSYFGASSFLTLPHLSYD